MTNARAAFHSSPGTAALTSAMCHYALPFADQANNSLISSKTIMPLGEMFSI
jgi:hypothetical protein